MNAEKRNFRMVAFSKIKSATSALLLWSIRITRAGDIRIPSVGDVRVTRPESGYAISVSANKRDFTMKGWNNNGQ